MTATDDNKPAIERDCLAVDRSGFTYCARCGTAWRIGAARPPCKGMTIGRMRDRLITEIEQSLCSHDVLAGLQQSGTPADPAGPLRRGAELSGVLRFFDRVVSNSEAMDLINPKRRSRQ